jgi:hypothetical protein
MLGRLLTLKEIQRALGTTVVAGAGVFESRRASSV